MTNCVENARDLGALTAPLRSILENSAEYPLVDLLAQEHRCDSSCYKCLQRFSNQHYHGLLDWRLGLDFIKAMLDHRYACGADGDFSATSLSDWPALAKKYIEQMKRFSGESEIRTIGPLYALKLRRKSRLWALAVHPFWNKDALPDLFPQVWRERRGDRTD